MIAHYVLKNSSINQSSQNIIISSFILWIIEGVKHKKNPYIPQAVSSIFFLRKKKKIMTQSKKPKRKILLVKKKWLVHHEIVFLMTCVLKFQMLFLTFSCGMILVFVINCVMAGPLLILCQESWQPIFEFVAQGETQFEDNNITSSNIEEELSLD